MKKNYAAFLLLFLLKGFTATADLVEIEVTGLSQFVPNNINVNVGDVIRFNFTGGFHNATTNGVPDGLPAGAAPLYSGDPGTVTTYNYTVTEPGDYFYVCEIHGNAASYSGMVGQFTASGVVPVTLKNFTVSAAAKKPWLQWTTETELNADYFAVKRSTDGLHFAEITRVPATGNSTVERSYNYIDAGIGAVNKFIYYELEIADKDGRKKLSHIKMFKNTAAPAVLINRLSPNPITRPGQLMVYYNAEKRGSLKIKVFDASGKMVFKDNQESFPGLNSGHIHVCDFSPGIYTLQFSMDGLSETRKVMVK